MSTEHEHFPTMTAAQTKLYFREWQAVRRLLRRQGVEPAIADKQRHVLHQDALGYQRSSKQLTNAELDRVLAEFRRYSAADNLRAQMAPAEQQRRRMLYVAEKLCRQLAAPFPAYADGIVRAMNAEGKLGARTLDTCDPAALRKVLAALTRQTKRPKPAPAAAPDPDLDPVAAEPF